MVGSRLDDAPSPYGRRLWLERGQMLRSGGITVNRDEVFRASSDMAST